MKRVVVILCLVALAVALVLTNPTTDDMVTYLKNQSKDGDSQALNWLSSQVTGVFAKTSVKSTNLGLFSIFKVQLPDDQHLLLGVMGNFIRLK